MTLSISFTLQIVAFGKASGRQFSRDEIETISTTMNSVVSLDDAGNIRFDLGSGPVGMMDDALTMLSVGMGAPVTAPTSTAPSIPPGANATERAVLMNQAVKAGADAAKREQAVKLAETFGNPWSSDRPNRSSQGFIVNHNPELATRLRAEAGRA